MLGWVFISLPNLGAVPRRGSVSVGASGRNIHHLKR